ncbi:hypothetical protein C0557_01845 [Kosakonia sp. MUSA4]|nr:hypothetical protein C0557_01845 [Kosakonia sp. MUSA4]
MFGESGFTHGDLLRGHNQYVGRSLKVNSSFKRDTYSTALQQPLNILALTAGDPARLENLRQTAATAG